MLVVSVLVILSSCTGVDYSVNTYFSLGLKISRILFLFLFLSLIVVWFLSLVLVLLIVLLFNFLPLCYFVRSSLRFCENFLMFCFLSHSALSCPCHLLFKSWLYFMNRYCLVLVIFVWPATIIQFRWVLYMIFNHLFCLYCFASQVLYCCALNRSLSLLFVNVYSLSLTSLLS